MNESFEVVIVGGGAAGITVAASLMRKHPYSKVCVIEPSEVHYYQPALTLVGAGVQTVAQNSKLEAHVMPKGVTWIKDKVVSFEPERNAVTISSGAQVGYGYLVVCAGLTSDWEKIDGLTETLGRNGVSSNYSPDYAAYTWECIQGLKLNDGAALFSQPPMPIKCPGAPQKIVYLAADYFRKHGRGDIPVVFNSATPGIFGVPYFARALMDVVAHYGVNFTPSSNLTAIDGEKKIATFTDNDGVKSEVPFGMLHVTPPQCAPKFISESSLSDDAGWLDVDKNTLQSTKHSNIFGLGDATNTPNSKTAAAIRKQAPVVVKNLAAVKRGAALTPDYDGYASCPLTTAYGKMMLAEFRYGGEVTPTIPLSPKVPRSSYWYIKKWGLAMMYWDFMLKGYEWDVAHNVNFAED